MQKYMKTWVNYDESAIGLQIQRIHSSCFSSSSPSALGSSSVLLRPS